MSKLEVLLWVTVNVSRRNSAKLAYDRICNTLLKSLSYYCIIFNFRKLVLSTNKALCLLKKLLIELYKNSFSTEYYSLLKLQSWVFTKTESLCKYFYSFMITVANYFFLWSTFKHFLERFNHFQELNTSKKFNLYLIFPDNIDIRDT